MLDRKHADRAFEPDDRHPRKAVEALLSGLWTISESRVAGRFGEVEDASFGGDRADKALRHPQPRHVDRFLAQAVRREQLQHVVAQQVDRADLAAHRLGDNVDDTVELGLRRPALSHDLVETRQDLASGGSCGGSHGWGASRKRPPG